MKKIFFIIFYIFINFWANVFYVYGNNLHITNVSLKDRFPDNGTVVVEFDISWDNSWRTKINHDGVWIT